MDTKLKSPPQAAKWWSSLDAQWQAIFKAAIRIKSEPTETELVTILNLTKLDCHRKKLTSLEPLRALTGLQTLNCGWNQLTSLEPLQACPGLQSLNCSVNHLTSLEPLQACPGLQTLDCWSNRLISLEPLRACPGLQTLDCRVNKLTSLEGLQALTGLQALNCSLNRLTSLEPLHGLKSLKELCCDNNPSLSQPEIERFLTKNRWYWWSSLDAQWQAIFKAAIGIRSEPMEDELVAILSLTKLDCRDKGLTSLEPLRVCTNLQTLDCGGNRLTSLEPLRACTGLQTLDCRVNKLTNLEGLQACPGLQTLNCSFNQLTSLEPLWACTGLWFLDYEENQLTSLEPLRACPGLWFLDCEENQLTSLEALHGLKSLRQLNCRNNPSLSEPEIEHFQTAVPSCEVSSTAEDQRQRERREVAKLREQREATKTAELGIDKIVPANNNFGFRLFDQLLQQDLGQNVFMSPLSVSLALAMTYNGAAGHTQTAMAKTLGLENLTLAEVNQANLALRNVLLHQSNPDMSLLIANSLWLNQDFHLEPTFLTPTQEFYAANVTNADFQSPATVSNINQWVKENTQGKIGPVVQTLDPLAVLLVINAIYFKGMWVEPFDRYYTKEREFTLLTGENKLIPMMSKHSDYYSYYEGNNYQAVRLRYRASSLSMTIFLPSRGTPLENFPLLDKWQEWRAGNTSREGTLVLPRFKVEYEVTLNDALKALGMAEAFSVAEADFSQMAKVPKGWNIYISQIKHKTFVEVNEEGTEAAAVTIIAIDSTCAPDPPPPFKMIVDHPFFLTIQDDSTGTVLFLGAIVEPK
jgi:serpin B